MKEIKQTLYKCESCGNVHERETSIGTCPFCGKDYCKYCVRDERAYLNTDVSFSSGFRLLDGKTIPICQDCARKLDAFDYEHEEETTKRLSDFILELNLERASRITEYLKGNKEN